MGRGRGTRLAVREARLITTELRRLGVPPRLIAKIWTFVLGVPALLLVGYLLLNYDPGNDSPTILSAVRITPTDSYRSHVKNNTGITLKSLTLRCSPGGDAQPVTGITGLYPPLESGYGEDAYFSGNCQLIRVNESHQIW